MSAKPQSIDRTLSQARNLAKQGDLTRAEELYHGILSRFPKNQRAIAGLRALSGQLFEQKRDSLRRSAIPVPEKEPALSALKLGGRMLREDRPDKAENAFAEALEQDPNCAEAHSGMSTALRRKGDNLAAVRSAQRAIAIKPDLGAAHENLGAALVGLDQHPEALLAFAEAMRLSPGFSDIYVKTAEALMALGKNEEALTSFGIALKLRPDAAYVHNRLGTSLDRMGRHDLAMESFASAMRLSPGSSTVQNNIGAVFSAMGDRYRAREHFAQAIELKNGHAQAHFNLANHTKYESGDPHLERMRNLLTRSGVPAEDRMYLNFALGKANEDIGEYGESFDYYSEGNRLRKFSSGYEIRTDIALFNRLKTLFPEAAAPVPDSTHHDGPRPIFVLGMPRSGTSLMEQILASHSQVHGAGELECLARSTARFFYANQNAILGGTAPEEFALTRTEYRGAIGRLGIEAPVFIDKMPLNFRFTGFALATMPEARVIHMVRDPIATCWSIFKHRFNSRGNGFAYDLTDLGHYFSLYRDLMAFWHERFPGRILDVNYEALTEHQEAETRRTLEFADLPWDETCLNFHQTERSVMTASADQVRRKMYRGSSDAWHNYEAWLDPLKAALGDVLPAKSLSPAD